MSPLKHRVGMFADANTPSPGSANIPAKSQHKAMEWSLVLASQGISHLIAPPDDAGNWSLRIAPEDVTRRVTGRPAEFASAFRLIWGRLAGARA